MRRRCLYYLGSVFITRHDFCLPSPDMQSLSQPTSELYTRYYSFEDAAPWHHYQAFHFGLRKLDIFPARNERFKPRVIHREGRPWRGLPPLPVQKSPGKERQALEMIAACCECDFPFHVDEFPNAMFTFISRRRKLFLLQFCLLLARVVDQIRESRRVPESNSQFALIPPLCIPVVVFGKAGIESFQIAVHSTNLTLMSQEGCQQGYTAFVCWISALTVFLSFPKVTLYASCTATNASSSSI